MKIKNLIFYTILLLLLDAFFLYSFMKKKYAIMIADIQGDPIKPKPFFIVCSYILMILGLHIFVLPKIKKKKDWIYGFLYGFILYGVYDFVCASIFNNWDLKLMLIDILWGGIVYSIVSYVYILHEKIK